MTVARGFDGALAARVADTGILNPSAYQIDHMHRDVRIDDPSTWTITLVIHASVARAQSGGTTSRSQ